MTRLLCCWELGGGFGHLYPLVPVLSAFRLTGAEVGFAVREVPRAQEALGKLNIQLFQSPPWQTPARSFPLSINYAQNLFRNGYWHLPSLTANLKAWIHLFEAFQPGFVLVDHAPTAILAARLMNIPRAALGTGLATPPLQFPMPSLHPWLSIPDSVLKEKELECVFQINQALVKRGAKRIRSVAELFEETHIFLTTFPELDHYGNRPDGSYLGPILSTATEQDPKWPVENGEKAFVYISCRYRFFFDIMEALRGSGLPVMAVIPDISEKEQSAWAGEKIVITRGPVNFKKAAEACGFAITHGGFNTANLVLLSGKPLFLLPAQLEQNLLSYRLARQELGMMVNWFNPSPNIEKKLDTMMRSKRLFQNAKDFSFKYRDYDSKNTIKTIYNFISSFLS